MENQLEQNYFLFHEYLEAVIGLLKRISKEEAEAVHQAALLIADAIQAGHNIFAFGCVHSSLSIQDLVYRPGGLMLINPIFGPGISSLAIKPVSMSFHLENLTGYARAILDNSAIKAGDVLILVTISGRKAVPIEMAQLARVRGIRVIGVASKAHLEAGSSKPPSAKKMQDFVDIILDNKVDPDDTVLQAEGIPHKFCSASGATSIALLQGLVSATIQELLGRGVVPPVFMADNAEGGLEYNSRLLEEYQDRIFYQ